MARSSRTLTLGLALTMLAPSVAMASSEPASPPIQRPSNLSEPAPSEAEAEAPSAESPAPPQVVEEGAVVAAPPESGEVPAPEDGAAPPAPAPAGEVAPPEVSPAGDVPAVDVPAVEPITPVEVRSASDPAEPVALDEALMVVGADGQPVELAPKPLPKRPFPGSGQITGGSVLIGLGTLTMATGIIILSISRDYPGLQVGGGIVLALGIGVAGGGAGLVYEGTRNRKKFLAWRRETGHQFPPPGNGMIVGGSILTGLGLLTIPSRPGLAVGELLTGGVLMGVGIHLHTKFNKTLKSHGLSLRPTFGGRQRMAGLSLSGRF